MNMMLSTAELNVTTAQDAILQLIADHKAAMAEADVAMKHYGDLEETIPEDRQRGDISASEAVEVATDDPRWTAACHWYSDATQKCDAIALQMLDTPVTGISLLAALLAYAGEHVERGYLWPDAIVDELLDDKKGRRWEQLVPLKAARTMRDLATLEKAQATVGHDLDPRSGSWSGCGGGAKGVLYGVCKARRRAIRHGQGCPSGGKRLARSGWRSRLCL
jgi:hypothetical protein